MESECDDGQQLVHQLRELSTRANAGDAQALDSLRALLAEDHRLVDHFGNLAHHIEVIWLNKVAAQDSLAREAVREHLVQLKATLAGPQPTAIEKLLVDQVVINILVDRHAGLLESNCTGSPQLIALRCRQAESAQKRLLAAVKMLTTLRAFAPAGLGPAQPRSHVERPKLSA